MKIVTIVSDLGIGGTQRCAQNYAIAYARQGHESMVATLRGSGPRREYLANNGVNVVSEQVGTTLDAIRRLRPHLIHLHRSDSLDLDAIAALRAARQVGSRTVQTNVFSRPDFASSSYLVDVDLQLSDWCLEKWLWRSRGIKCRPLSAVLPYSVDDQRFRRVSEADIAEQRLHWGVPPEAIILGRIGQPLDSKWSLDIFDVQNASALMRANVFYVLVGAPPSIREYVANSSVASNVIFVSPMNDDFALQKCYSAFDFFLHSAEMGESFGMVIAESILCGTPVITRARILRDNTHAELVVKTGGGWVAWSDRQFAEIVEAAAARRLRCDMQLARARLVDGYGSEICATRLAALADIVTSRSQSEWGDELTRRGLPARSKPDGLREVCRRLNGRTGWRDLICFHVTHQGVVYRQLKRGKSWIHNILRRRASRV